MKITRSWRRFRLSAVSAVVVAGLLLTPSAARADPRFNPPKDFSLALGDSAAFGYQEAKFRELLETGTYDPARFDTGYVDVFQARLAAVHPGIETINYSCPGETTATFIAGGCFFRTEEPFPLHEDYSPAMPQLAVALDFLRAHPGQVSPVTISLGSDDLLLPYLFDCDQDLACIEPRVPGLLDQVRANLGAILNKLTAASPSSEIILLAYYNPFELTDPRTTRFVLALNEIIADVATTHGARVADAFTPFNLGPQPDTLCMLTLMCATPADIHPSDAGYAVIAEQFWAASGYERLGED
jgi:lysophospholipase L1-like esterase